MGEVMYELTPAEAGVDPAVFFGRILPMFGDGAELYMEGTSISDDVARDIHEFLVAGPYIPMRQTVFPNSLCIRCCITPELCCILAACCAKHAVPEICDHVFVYRHSGLLLGWPDAFTGIAYLSHAVSEQERDTIAKQLNMKLSIHTVQCPFF